MQMVGDMPLHPLLHLLADQGKIAQVVRNLLSNALKFTNRNGTVRVKVFVEEDSATGAGSDEVDAAAMPPLRNKNWKTFFRSFSSRLFWRSSKTYSEMTLLMAAKCLVIEVVDSGIGISSVIITYTRTSLPVCCIITCYSFVQERQLNLFENMILFKPGVLQPGQGAGLGLYSERV